MKLEKLLAENMLRFGVKNLNNTDVRQILTIMEQAASEGTEDPRVTALPAYKPVLEWWNKNSAKNSIAKRSLNYWTGADAKGGVASEVLATKNLLKHLQTLSKNSASLLDKTKINDLITYLDTNIKKNIYFKPRSAGAGDNAMYVIQVLAGIKTDGDPNRTVLQGANGKTYVDAFNKVNLDFITGKLKTTEFPFAYPSAEDKIALLNYFTTQANKKIAMRDKTANPIEKLVKWDLDKAIQEASSISIAPGLGDIQTLEAATPPPPVVGKYTFSYPDVNNPKDLPKLQNFYLDDNVTTVSAENADAFKTMLQNLLAQIPQDEKIIEVHIKAGSSTSTVPTTYGNPTYVPGGSTPKEIEANIKLGQQGNIALVNERLKEIQKTLTSVVDTTVPKGDWQLIVDTPQSKPNNAGPDGKATYTAQDRVNFAPAKRKANPSVKQAYDAKYGQYKGSFGQISIVTETGEVETRETEPGLQVTTEWAGKISWPSGAKGGKQKPLRGSNKGERPWTGSGTMDCPLW